MGTRKRIYLSLALGIGFSVLGAAQGAHGGGEHGHAAGQPSAGFTHSYGAVGHPNFGRNSLGPMPNTVSGFVGVGADHNYYGLNGFHNPRGPGYDQSRRGDYRRGVGVGVIPFYPIGGYYGGYDGAYDDGTVPYDQPADEGQPGPYQAGPYQPAPYMDQPQQAYPPPMAPPPMAYESPQPVTPDAKAPVAPMPPVTIVLRTGQQLQVKNFAVTNGFFWDFSKAAPHKIPLANIDMAASEKVTEANGGEFPDLNGNAGSSTN